MAFSVSKVIVAMVFSLAWRLAQSKWLDFPHLVLGESLLHGFCKLPCDDFLDGPRLRFLEYAFLLEKSIDAGSHMLLAHRSNCFLRLRAIAKSEADVTRVLVMNP